jgi:anti-sigma B factor antagonist
VNTNLELVGDVAVVELLGESLDALGSDDVKAQLCGLAADHPKLVVDLHRVAFLDSSGCGALVTAQKRCHEAGGDLRVCRVTPQVKTVFDLARVSRVLSLFTTREAAVASFGG